MKDAADEWNKITDRLGREKQVAVIQSQVAAYSTVVDTPKIVTS